MKKLFKLLLYFFLLVFVLLNGISFYHAYKLTHFDIPGNQKDKNSILSKVIYGMNRDRAEIKKSPNRPYEAVILQSNKEIEAWHIHQNDSNWVDSVKGTVLMFHGYGGSKDKLIEKSNEIMNMGYHTFLVDFMGGGCSEGNECTIGIDEAEQVKTAYEYIQQTGEKNIVIYGVSMGAVSIMKCIKDYDLKPKALILECPFGSLLNTSAARLEKRGAPPYPLSHMLLFWGSIQTGSWVFDHNPSEYAKSINIPTLLSFGEKDHTIPIADRHKVFENLNGKKVLKVYDNAPHEIHLEIYREDWVESVSGFLTAY